MKALNLILLAIATIAVVLVNQNSGQISEDLKIPFFHRVLVVNNEPRPIGYDTRMGLVTAVMELESAEGKWHPVAKLRAPISNSMKPVLSAGEKWLFIIPDVYTGFPATVRLMIKTADGAVYSEPFKANVDLLAVNQTIDCWLARIRHVDSYNVPELASANTRQQIFRNTHSLSLK